MNSTQKTWAENNVKGIIFLLSKALGNTQGLKLTILNEFLNQTIASTHEDLHGEVRTKEFFEELIRSYPKRMPLHQHHDMSKETLGYLEEFRVVEDPEKDGHFLVKADIYVTGEYDASVLRGFSISFLEKLYCESETPLYYIYLPYPAYNDSELINYLANESQDMFIGKFVKKSIDPITIGLKIIDRHRPKKSISIFVCFLNFEVGLFDIRTGIVNVN